jgi:hypothetical protein
MPDASVQSAVGRELARRHLSPGTDPLAAIALALAEALDDTTQSAAGRATAAKQLEAVLTTIRDAAKPIKGDAVDDLASRRANRRAAR